MTLSVKMKQQNRCNLASDKTTSMLPSYYTWELANSVQKRCTTEEVVQTVIDIDDKT